MRLWHKDLITKLPREQLVAQWRECSAIGGFTLDDSNRDLFDELIYR